MSVTRINMIEFDNETVADTLAAEYQKNARKQFPDADLLIAFRTSPTSAITISVYPNEETAERALEMRAQRMNNEKDVSGWHMEGEISLFDLKKDHCLDGLSG
jgi:hypothetical protein